MFFGLEVEAVLDGEHQVAREGVGVGDGTSGGGYGVVDVGEFVQQVEAVSHKHPAGVAWMRVSQAYVPHRVGGVKIVDAVAAAHSEARHRIRERVFFIMQMQG